MAITVEETEESRALRDGYEANQKVIELEFIAWDMSEVSVNPVTVKAAVSAVVNASPYGDPLYGLYLQTINLRPLTRYAFMASVVYGVYEPPKINQIRFGFNTAGGTEHITHSLSTINRYAATGEPVATNFNQALNVTRDGVHGTQRGVGQLAFWVSGYFDPDDWTATDWLNLADLSFTYNSSTWHGWPAKHVLFEYAEAPEVILGQSDLVPVKFYFKARRPKAIAPAAGISFTADPWDYIWHYYVPTTDNAAKRLAQKIASTNREQLFSAADLSLLGLGS